MRTCFPLDLLILNLNNIFPTAWLNEGDNYLLAQNFPLHRHLLHALEINFPHPVTNKKTIIRTNDTNLLSELKP